MRTAVSIGLFGVLVVFHGCASAEEWTQYRYPKSGFTAEFTGTVREIDLKPDAKTRDYIRSTSIFAQAGNGFSYSVTAREYRFGMPDIQNLAKVLADRLHCSAKVKTAPISGGGLALSGDGCVSNGSTFVARLLARGRWFYQALAVVSPKAAKDAGQFVATLQLTDVAHPNAARKKQVARRNIGRRTARRAKAAGRATSVGVRTEVPSQPFIARQNWQPPSAAGSSAPGMPTWWESFARAP
jgi:hypothetical protein